jgi:hypothetical protein
MNIFETTVLSNWLTEFFDVITWAAEYNLLSVRKGNAV